MHKQKKRYNEYKKKGYFCEKYWKMKYILSAHVSLSFWQKLLHEIADKTETVIELHWHEVEHIATEALAFYLCLQKWCESKQIDIQHV